MIDIIRYPNKPVLKYTCLCSLCGTQWMCDKADIKWKDDFFIGTCPLCGFHNYCYNYEKEKRWTDFQYYNGSYEIPILNRERTENSDYC